MTWNCGRSLNQTPSVARLPDPGNVSVTCCKRVLAFVNYRMIESIDIKMCRCAKAQKSHLSMFLPQEWRGGDGPRCLLLLFTAAHVLMICGESVALGGLPGNSLCNVAEDKLVQRSFGPFGSKSGASAVKLNVHQQVDKMWTKQWKLKDERKRELWAILQSATRGCFKLLQSVCHIVSLQVCYL